jgi:hypothetical protein
LSNLKNPRIIGQEEQMITDPKKPFRWSDLDHKRVREEIAELERQITREIQDGEHLSEDATFGETHSFSVLQEGWRARQE